MKKTATMLAVLLSLSACSGTPETPKPTPTVTESNPAPVVADLGKAQRAAEDCAIDAAEASGQDVAVGTVRGGSVVQLSADGSELTVAAMPQLPPMGDVARAAIKCANEALGIDSPDMAERVMATLDTDMTQRESFDSAGVRVEWWPETAAIMVKWQKL